MNTFMSWILHTKIIYTEIEEITRGGQSAKTGNPDCLVCYLNIFQNNKTFYLHKWIYSKLRQILRSGLKTIKHQWHLIMIFYTCERCKKKKKEMCYGSIKIPSSTNPASLLLIFNLKKMVILIKYLKSNTCNSNI